MLKHSCRQITAFLLAMILLMGSFAVPAEEYVEYSAGFSLSNMRATTYGTVNLYVCIEGVWTNIGAVSALNANVNYGYQRDFYVVELADVAAVYAPYGFDSSSYTAGQACFPYSQNNNQVLSVLYQDNNWPDNSKICIGRNYDFASKTFGIYYAPNGTTGSTILSTNIAAANSFYPVSVTGLTEDELAGVAYGNTHYVNGRQLALYGDTVEVTVPYSDGSNWAYSGSCTSVSEQVDGATKKYTFSGVTGAIELSRSGGVEVTVVVMDITGNIASSNKYTVAAGGTLPDEAFAGMDSEYKWYDYYNNEITNVKQKTFTESTTIVTRPTEHTSGVQADYYIYLDDRWECVHSDNLLYGKYTGRYLVSLTQLEDAFGDYGFTAEDFYGSAVRQIGYNINTLTSIWADTDPVVYYGSRMLPLNDYITHYNIYYLPNNSAQLNGIERSNVQGANGFHTVTLTENDTGAAAEFVLEDGVLLKDWLDGMGAATLSGWEYPVNEYLWYTDEALNVQLSAEATAGDIQALTADRQSSTVTLTDVWGTQLGVDADVPNGTLLSDWLKENADLILADGRTVHEYKWMLPNDTPIGVQTVTRDVALIGTKKPVYTVTFIDNAEDSGEEGGSFINGSADYTTVSVIEGDCVPAEFIALMRSNVQVNDEYAFIEWRFEGNEGYLVLNANTPIINDTVVWAAYTQEVYVRFWKDHSQNEQFASAGYEKQPIGQRYIGAVPDMEEILAVAPAQGMRFRYWMDINSGLVFTVATDHVKGNLDLYPVFERAIFEFVDADGRILAVLYDGTELMYEAEEEDGSYYAGLNVPRNDGSETVLANGTGITISFLNDEEITYTGPVNGRYTIVAEPVYKLQRRIVYHTGPDAQFIIFGAEDQASYTVMVNDSVVLLGALDIMNIVSPIGLALAGWSTDAEDGTVEFAVNEHFDGEDQLSRLIDAGGTVDLYPVWSQQQDTVELTFVSNYPADATDANGNILTNTSYTVYIKSGSKPTMPTLAKTGMSTPANIVGDSSKYLMAGWSKDSDGDLSNNGANVDGTYTEQNGTYTEGSQYAHAIYSATTFYAIWVDTSPEQGITAYFHIRIDGTLPQEPGQYVQSGYLPGACGDNVNSWVGTIKKKINVVNNVPEVEANILSEPDIQTILNVMQNSSELKAVAPNIVDETAADYGVTWWIDWYACKYSCNSHYHVDGRLRFIGQVELNYHPNGGSNVPGGVVCDKDQWEQVNSTQIPVRENFTFVGWDEDPAASVPDYPAAGITFPTSPNLKSIYMDADKDLYAIWQPNRITIPLDDDFKGRKYEQTNQGAPTAPADGRVYQFTIEAISLPEGALPYAKRTVTSAADGTFSFPRVDVQVPGMYVFEVREVIGDLPVQYDTAVYRLTANIIISDYGFGIGGYSFTRDNKMITVENNVVDNIVFTFINRTDVRDVTVSKLWADASDQDGIRPESVTVTLLRKDDSVFRKTVELTRAGNWTYTWEGIDIKEPSSGLIYEYYVEENAVSGYTAEYLGDMNSGLVIRNTHEPATTDIRVIKRWEDGGDSANYRPETVSYTVTGRIADGTVVVERSSGEVASPWHFTFAGLPMFSNGQGIIYTLTESDIPGYEPTIMSVDGNTVIVTNTLKTAGITVTKQTKGNAADVSARFDFTAIVYNPAGNAATGLSANEGYTVDENGVLHFSLSHGETVSLVDLPLGGSIVICEDNGLYTESWSEGGTAEGDGMKYTIVSGTDITVTNTLEVQIPTGVRLDLMPYLMLLTAAVCGLAFCLWRRRRD